MPITPIKDLKPTKLSEAIKARVCRLWKTYDFNANRLLSLDCILVDEQNDAIQATMKVVDADFFVAKLDVGSIYHISKFYIAYSKNQYRVVPHIGMLQFGRATRILKIPNKFSTGPTASYPKKQPISPTEEKNINRKTISELKNINPNQNKKAFFTCQAEIIKFDETQGWFYKTCPQCFVRAKNAGPQWWCSKHGYFSNPPTPRYRLVCHIKDETRQTSIYLFGRVAHALVGVSCATITKDLENVDEHCIPPTLSNMIGSTRNFQLHYSANLARPYLIASKVTNFGLVMFFPPEITDV
ncbi:hypothetical protein GH714_034886 [Hevea brasiliensis]|uniref:Uncharacterized protein n=1 Tax=Hevea brasiliensis TaxID=3981 RepID=A0A6A6NED4_HEVBR|nr:hypothetical protein GH714_034886 [Hevea brasiliensis]